MLAPNRTKFPLDIRSSSDRDRTGGLASNLHEFADAALRQLPRAHTRQPPPYLSQSVSRVGVRRRAGWGEWAWVDVSAALDSVAADRCSMRVPFDV
jgi:hypothetical protein